MVVVKTPLKERRTIGCMISDCNVENYENIDNLFVYARYSFR